jgi:hypothetical protein
MGIFDSLTRSQYNLTNCLFNWDKICRRRQLITGLQTAAFDAEIIRMRIDTLALAGSENCFRKAQIIGHFAMGGDYLVNLMEVGFEKVAVRAAPSTFHRHLTCLNMPPIDSPRSHSITESLLLSFCQFLCICGRPTLKTFSVLYRHLERIIRD